MSDNDIIRFCSPHTPSLINVFNSMGKSFSTGRLSNFGSLYKEAVVKLEKYFGVDVERKVVLTSSGHTALMAAYAAVGAKSILMSTYTFESTRAAATLQGMNVILVDTEEDNPCLTVESIKKVNLSSYDTVVAVCPLSIVPDLKSISDFCKENNKKLVIDGAATFGTTNSYPIFNYGDVYCMSFHATKTLSVGECGCTISNEELSEVIKRYIMFGFDENRVPVVTGMNAKVSEYTCAILLDLLSTIDPVLMVKGANTYYYNKKLSGKVIVPKSYADDTMYQFFPIFVKDEETRDNIIRRLTSNRIEAMSYYRPLMQLPNACSLFSRNICLPNHHKLSLRDVNTICSIVLDLA